MFLSFFSCTKDLELPFEKTDNTIVVNCLFSEDENWQVIITRVKSFGDKTDPIIEDAKVVIVPENSDTINLKYKGDGIYYAEERPVKGTRYQIIIKCPNSIIITAKSSIPSPVNISSIKFTDQKTIYFSNPNLSDYETVPLSLNISANDQQNFVRFRFYSFNTDRGYKRYSVTKQTIATLREMKISEAFLEKLETLIGKSFNSYEFGGIFKKMADEYNLTYNEYANIVIPEIQVTKVTYRSPDAFLIGYIFPNSNWLNNVSRDLFNVLGEYSGTQEANLFVDYIPVLNKNDRTDYTEEYWLETTGMSEEYYNYQKLYIKQVVNLSNPFSSPVEVYSNINNGLGIFAGYNKQMIHFFDY